MNLVPHLGFFEIIVVAIVILVVVGPQDLPKLMRTAGKMLAQLRKMGAEFTAAFEQMARESEMEEMRKEIDAIKNDNVFAETKRSLEDAVKPVEDAVREEAAELRDAAAKPGRAAE